MDGFSLICDPYLLKYSECIHNEDKEAEKCVGVVIKKQIFSENLKQS